MHFQIDDYAPRRGLTEAIRRLVPGQSHIAMDTSYAIVYATIRQARLGRKRPIKGEFEIVSQFPDVRIMRVS